MVRCEFRRSHLLVLRNVLVLIFLVVLGLPWILISYLETTATHPNPSTWLEPKNNTNRLRVNPTALYVFYSCNDIFASGQLVRKGACLQHQLLQWVACEIGPIWIQPNLVDGSLGGEDMDQVWSRPEAQEQLIFEKGSLLLQNPNIPSSLMQSVDGTMRRFLQSAMSVSSRSQTRQSSAKMSMDITLLVHRGNYANPCMTLLTIYNVYIILEYYYNYFQEPTRSLWIVWLDGHARGDLDVVWTQLFQTEPLHIKQLSAARQDFGDQSPVPLPGHAMVVNTMSAMGDEGMGLFDWGIDAKTTPCWNNSTLIQFRNFVLERYGLLSHRSRVGSKILTLLVRKDYRAHPRSTGYTDRTLSNVTADSIYLQRLYPNHTVQVVSFEGVPFVDQLRCIISTDILVSVHGAGNIHVLFLPDTATLVEYMPKPFGQRRRFKYLAACLNIRYIAMPAAIERRRFVATNITTSERSHHGSQELIQVRLRPN